VKYVGRSPRGARLERFPWEGPALYIVAAWFVFPAMYLVAKLLLGLAR